nr:multifunctional CCA tRNA nucleotidyl transferase/2'3'-cyclic phosphodiesterase/2'nucleotidase/phosphatase [uncultured Marinobacter sp.]
MQTYLVGGAVRDELLGLEVKDRDWVVVGATPGDMLAQGFKQVGADFPVFLHPTTREEYALARTERKSGRGYHGFQVYSAPDVTLEDDLRRRDLTINAMAKTRSGDLVDPFNGRQDLEAQVLRHVSDAFAEDPLRILRTARFAARFHHLGFTVSDDTMTLMARMVSEGEVEHLAPERVWQEMHRALHEKTPTVFFEVLRECGALTILIPELTGPEFEPAMAALACVHQHHGATEARFAGLLSPLAEATCTARAKALKAPNDCQSLARLTSDFMARVRAPHAGQLTAETLLLLLDKADIWRRPGRFSQLQDTLRCALPPTSTAGLSRLEKAAEAATGVDPKVLLAEGYQGKALGQAIRTERLARIEQTLTPTRN